jgi:hypothetical protein
VFGASPRSRPATFRNTQCSGGQIPDNSISVERFFNNPQRP